MAQKKKDNQNGEPDEEFKTLFKEARKIDAKRTASVNRPETEEAFRRVTKKAGIKKRTRKPRIFLNIAAAAIVILGFVGIAFLLVPKQVEAPPGKTLTVNLPDGSRAILNSGSSLDYRRWFLFHGRTVSLRGEAFFDVKHTGTPFEVKAGQARVTVLGTKFDVRYWPKEHNYKTSVYLKEGQVKFSSIFHKKQTITLKPGEYSWVSAKHTQPVQPKAIQPSKAMAWLQGGLSFTDQPLSIILAEISRRFNVTIKIEPVSLGKEKLTLYLSQVKNASRPIADICRAKGLKFTKKGNAFIITKSF
jgi:ferric-dicitrate binding protein FerR (iron transport regulator)